MDNRKGIEQLTTTEDDKVDRDIVNESDVSNSKPEDSPEKKEFQYGIGKRVRGRKSKKSKEICVEKSTQPKKTTK